MVVIIFFLYLWGGEVSCSTVYRCESELGKVTYQGLPCSKEFNRQDKLFFKTALSDVSNKSSNQKKQIKLKEKKKLAKKYLRLAVLNNCEPTLYNSLKLSFTISM